jgi:flagellar hook-length control protein FliK
MQQVAQAAPTLPPADVSMVARGEGLAMANQGTDVSVAPLENLSQQTADSKTSATSQPGTSGEASSEILVIDRDAGVPLAANAATDSGKALPQDLTLVQEKTSFAEMFFERRSAKDEFKESSWATPGQVAAQPLAPGLQAGKALAQHVVAEPVGDSRWGDAVAQRVSMMLGKQEQQVDMQLNPPHLGPMEVRLTLGQEQASVIFTSQHAAVREALAAATPKLSALLADQGIQLVNVQVASDSLNQQAQEQSHQQQAATFSGRGQDGRSGQRPLHELTMPRWSGEVTVPVARSGVSLYV